MPFRYCLIVVSVFLFKNNSYSQNGVKYVKDYIQENWVSSTISDCSDFDIEFIDNEDDGMEVCEYNKPAYCRPFFSVEDEGDLVFFNASAVEQLGYYSDEMMESIPSKEDWETLQNKMYSLPNQPGCHLFSRSTRFNCNHSNKGVHKYCSPDMANAMEIPCSVGFVYMKNDEIVFEEGKMRFWCESTTFYTEFNLKNGSMKLKENIVNSNLKDEMDLEYAGYPIILKKRNKK